jgi:hypothetical protein
MIMHIAKIFSATPKQLQWLYLSASSSTLDSIRGVTLYFQGCRASVRRNEVDPTIFNLR